MKNVNVSFMVHVWLPPLPPLQIDHSYRQAQITGCSLDYAFVKFTYEKGECKFSDEVFGSPTSILTGRSPLQTGHHYRQPPLPNKNL
jgi:hypothetical protein